MTRFPRMPRAGLFAIFEVAAFLMILGGLLDGRARDMTMISRMESLVMKNHMIIKENQMIIAENRQILQQILDRLGKEQP